MYEKLEKRIEKGTIPGRKKEVQEI